MSDIWVIIPAFNEADSIPDLLYRLPPNMSAVVINDGSCDGTAERARKAGAEVISHVCNRGRGAAVKTGLDFLRAREYPPTAVAIMDADGQHPPERLEDLLEPILNGEAQVVIGVRYLEARSRGSAPLNRFLVNRFVTAVVRRLTSIDLWDPFCGFRAFDWETISHIVLRGDRYETELEMLFEIERLGLRVRTVRIPVLYPPKHSKMGQLTRFPLLSRVLVIHSYLATIVRGFARLKTLR